MVLALPCLVFACTSAEAAAAEIEAEAEFSCPEMTGTVTSRRGRTNRVGAYARVRVEGCDVVATYDCFTSATRGTTCQRVSAYATPAGSRQRY